MTRTLLIATLLFSFQAYSQTTDSLIKQWDSSQIIQSGFLSSPIGEVEEETYEAAKIDFKTYFHLLHDDFKQQLTKPLHTKKKGWFKVGGFALATGVVTLINKPVNRFAVNLHKNNPGVAAASNYITNFGGMYEVYTLAGIFTHGLLFKSQKEKTTTILATQAYVTAVTIAAGAKYLAAQQRPYYTDPHTQMRGPIFHGPLYVFKKGLSASDYASFPSGHTTAAFAAATVFAMEYKNKPLIPIISYGAASLIGLSRLTENKHWPIDIFVGGMLGYLSGRQVVNNYHRYSRLKEAGKKADNNVTFNLQYNNGHIEPGMTYNF